MYSKIKSEIKEIVQIVNECPASLQEKCFEVLLSHLLMEVGTAGQKANPSEVSKSAVADAVAMNGMPEKEEVKSSEVVNGEIKKQEAKNGSVKKAEEKPVKKVEPAPVKNKKSTSGGSGVQLTDFHSKVQNLLDAGSISIERINDLYVKEKGTIYPAYSDLATDQPHVAQICLALLSAFEDSFFTGAFEFEMEAVRERCQKMDCYQVDNFSQNFSNVKQLFWEDAEFNKGSVVKLSPEGKKALLEVLSKIK